MNASPNVPSEHKHTSECTSKCEFPQNVPHTVPQNNECNLRMWIYPRMYIRMLIYPTRYMGSSEWDFTKSNKNHAFYLLLRENFIGVRINKSLNKAAACNSASHTMRNLQHQFLSFCHLSKPFKSSFPSSPVLCK